MPEIEYLLMIIIAVYGAGTMLLVFRNMGEGFGPYNLRVTGIVLIATFASLLALNDPDAMTAAMGILGAIAGYLFGIKSSPPKTRKKGSPGGRPGDG